MILSDKTLKCLLSSGELVVSPLTHEVQIQPASIDIRLGNTYARPIIHGSRSHDSSIPIQYEEIETNSYSLGPKQFILATTKEYIKLPNNMTAFVEGRSSIGRMGIFIQNAGWVDPGFEGEITLELFNASDMSILLHEGMRIGQLVFAQLDRDAENPYRGKYQGQKRATGSKVYLDSDLAIPKEVR